MYEHTEQLLNASERWLREATVETISSDMQIALAFVSAYIAMQAVQPPYPGPPGSHPVESILTEGATALGLSEPDLKLGVALRQWEDWGRYYFEPPPVSVGGALEWAGRVRDAAVSLQMGAG